jgi:hypothetical protein
MRLRSVLIATMIGCLAFTACEEGDDATNDQSQTSEDGGAPQELTGPIIDIDSESLGDVRSFTLKSGDQTYEILIDPHVDYGFALSHLNEHRLNGAPVRVELLERGGRLFAQSIVDA